MSEQSTGGGRSGTQGLVPHDVEMSAIESRHLVLIDQMIAWQIANPGKKWTLAAAALGVSVMWLRMVASTDAYKARYSTVGDQMIREVGMLGLKEKIAAAAELAVEKLAEKIEMSESLGDIRDAAELLLETHYGGGGGKQTAPASVQVNNIIMEARGEMMSRKKLPGPVTIEQAKGV